MKHHLERLVGRVQSLSLMKNPFKFSLQGVGQRFYRVLKVARSSHPRQKVKQPSRENGTAPGAKK